MESYRHPIMTHRLTLRSGPGARNGVQIQTACKIRGRYVKTWGPGAYTLTDKRSILKLDCFWTFEVAKLEFFSWLVILEFQIFTCVYTVQCLTVAATHMLCKKNTCTEILVFALAWSINLDVTTPFLLVYLEQSCPPHVPRQRSVAAQYLGPKHRKARISLKACLSHCFEGFMSFFRKNKKPVLLMR